MNTIYFEPQVINDLLSTEICMYGGPSHWRNYDYYKCCGSTYLTNYEQIYIKNPDFVSTKVVRDNKLKDGSPITTVMIFHKDFPDDVTEEWWIVKLFSYWR